MLIGPKYHLELLFSVAVLLLLQAPASQQASKRASQLGIRTSWAEPSIVFLKISSYKQLLFVDVISHSPASSRLGTAWIDSTPIGSAVSFCFVRSSRISNIYSLLEILESGIQRKKRTCLKLDGWTDG